MSPFVEWLGAKVAPLHTMTTTGGTLWKREPRKALGEASPGLRLMFRVLQPALSAVSCHVCVIVTSSVFYFFFFIRQQQSTHRG